ncbi:MAG: stage II sporulation protein P [Clostridia bacterium]|nr:stage II sporulation protein P [Clostridia bacterium]
MQAAAAGLTGVLLLSAPLNWGQVSRTMTVLAASMRQPAEAAALLEERLNAAERSPVADGLQTPPAATEPPSDSSNTPAPPSSEATNDLSASPSVPAMAPPKEDGSGGKIYERKMSTGDRLPTGIATLNRSGTSVDVAAALRRELPIRWVNSAEPQVLLIHTHTTEGYMLYDAGYYNAADRARTRDESRNVCAVGEAVKRVLEQAGIGVIHDTTVHDDPKYTGAYTRSAETVKKNLKKYPSIQVVLDLHRDAVMEGENGLVKPTVTIDGKKAAQMMLLTGVVSTKALPHKNWEKNLTVAARLQQALDKDCPNLMRPLNLMASRYNQQLSTGYLLVEVGSEGNTLAEAVYSAELLGKTLAKLLA